MFSKHLSIPLVVQCIHTSIYSKIVFNRNLVIHKNSPSIKNPSSRMLSVTNCLHVEDAVSDILDSKLTKKVGLEQETEGKLLSTSRNDQLDDYTRCIRDLNLLQSNTQTIALAKYKHPEEILPLFTKQLELSRLEVSDLDKLNIIHVSGTKGKGSTCAFVESILRAGGKKTGFYNSPHLVKVTERIRIDGIPISDEKFSKYFRKVYDCLLEGTFQANITMPSYFSFLTLLAFHIFLEEKVDCAVIEVGIGGEYDPTNVVQRPIACGISTLDYDHTNILGNSIEDIAWSKAGILKKDIPVFVVDQQPEAALNVIRWRSEEKHCPLYICGKLEESSGVQLGIQGSAQFMNAALACQLSKYLLKSVFNYELSQLPTSLASEPTPTIVTNLSHLPAFFQAAITNCSWAGRCQILRYSNMSFYLDGAHTKKSMKNCLDWFLTSSVREDVDARRILMLNIIGDRNKSEILSQLCEYDGFECVIFSSNRINSAGDTPKSETFLNIQGPNSDKSMENVLKNANTWRTLRQQRKISSHDTIIMSNTSDSVEFIRQKAKENPGTRYHILATGSLHFVGAISETLDNFEVD